jgi:hypothetical protein
MGNPENLGMKVERSRRNIVKIGAILTSALVATFTTRAVAATIIPVPPTPLPPTPIPTPIPIPTPTHHCFLRGTSIRTANGDRKIEDLTIGDLLPTMFGGMRPIEWIGRYPFKKSDPSKPSVKGVLPVRIIHSALAPNVPQADLYVTKAHALFIDGVLRFAYAQPAELGKGLDLTTLIIEHCNRLRSGMALLRRLICVALFMMRWSRIQNPSWWYPWSC